MNIVQKDGRQLKGYFLDGTGMKDIPFSSVTSDQLNEWFGTGSDRLTGREYYERVVALFRCVELRAQTVASMPRQIINIETGTVVAAAKMPQSHGTDEDGNPLPDDKNLPFDIKLSDFLWRTEAALSLVGGAYGHKERNRVRMKAVRWIDPATVTPWYSPARGLTHFTRQPRGLTQQTILPKDMVAVWRPTLNEWGHGVAPGEVAAKKAGIADHMDTFIEMFFEQGAMPTTVVFAETKPPKQERERIQKYLDRIMTGVRNAFGIEVLSAGLKFETLQPPLKDMVLPNIESSAQRGIVVAMGVPMSIVFSDASTFATAKTDDLHFYTKTIIPEIDLIADQLNDQLFDPLGLRLVFRPDLLEIFQQQEAEKVDKAIQLYDRSAIDENELRAAGGYAPRQTAVASTPSPTDEDEEVEEVEEEGIEETTVDDEEAKRLALAELKQWERKVLKRFPKSPAYTVPFEPKHLDLFTVVVVREALMNAETQEEVKAAFAAPFCVSPKQAVARRQAVAQKH